MKNSSRLATAMFGICLALGFGASADDTPPPQDLGEIRAQQIELRAEIEAGNGIFEGLSDTERRELVARQTRLLSLIEGKETVQDLDDETQVAAFNLLQDINVAINDAEDERVVCEYRPATGSHRKVKDCSTIGERRRAREEAGRTLDRVMNAFCAGASGCQSG